MDDELLATFYNGSEIPRDKQDVLLCIVLLGMKYIIFSKHHTDKQNRHSYYKYVLQRSHLGEAYSESQYVSKTSIF